MSAYSQKFKEGFLTTYALTVFFLTLFLVTIITTNRMNQLKSMENIKKLRQFEAQETNILYTVKKELANYEPEEQEAFQCHFSIPSSYSLSSHTLTVTILSEYYETIIIDLDFENQCVIDYETIREIP
ncbi:MAG: hypothetical protein J6D29_08175 [Solobacterium sp.]|nr:hypothetical protein [Solobacterium sp.]